MATPNRFAIRDAGIATFYDLVTGKAICTLTTLKTSGLNTTGETVSARGGRGNPKIVNFSGNRETTITMEDAIFDNSALFMLTGNVLETGTKNIAYQEVVTVASNTATLSKTPVGALTTVYEVNPDGTNGVEIKPSEGVVATGEYSISGKDLTFFDGDFEDGKKIRVYYTVTTDATAKTIRVTSDKFGGTFKCILDVLVRDEFTKKDFQAQVVVPNGKFSDSFDIALSADGDPATLNLELECLKDPLSTDLWYMVVYDDALVV